MPYKKELEEAKANYQRAIQSANDANARLDQKVRDLQDLVAYQNANSNKLPQLVALQDPLNQYSGGITINLKSYWAKYKVKAVYEDSEVDVINELKKTVNSFIGMPMTPNTKQHIELAIEQQIKKFIFNGWVRCEDR